MIYVGIDVAKDKHDCFIINSDGEVLFPELEKPVPALYIASVYVLLSELPSARTIASCPLTHLTKLLENASKGRYSREKAIEIRNGSNMPAKSLELRHTLRLIGKLDSEITEIESEIKQTTDQISFPILSIPGIGYRMGAMILAEIGDFPALIHRIRSLHMLELLHPPINPGSWNPLIPIWKRETHAICVLP